MRNDRTDYAQLEERLLLLSWLNRLLGFRHNRDLLAEMRCVAEGFDASGHSNMYHYLLSRGNQVKLSATELARYDDNIREHLRAMNARRAEPITLRYFQYLAALYTEIYLDAWFNRPGSLRQALIKHNYAAFSGADLKKLAFWMATGSGKTLIMHLNYRQFLHYNPASAMLDNILLITPNEGLTEQHIEEMTTSNIPCRRFDLNDSGLALGERNLVRVIEITKLVEEKRGGGLSVPVEAFEGNNLIFVDEGHKGAGGDTWRGYRDALGQTGFTFEYSATFGQALTAARNDALTAEYGNAIVFDYSYRYFHGDGYGKDFRILNLREETTSEKTDALLLGNLLSFYEQQRVYAGRPGALRPYNLEKPLWVFVGSSVNAVYTKNRQKRSDVLNVARFLHRFLMNEGGWAVTALREVLNGQTGLFAPDGSDIFAGKFAYLTESNIQAEDLYRSILKTVFHATAASGLHLCDLRGHTGELGLKAAGADDYFGVIYIGDTSAFKKLAEEDNSGIVLEEDAITDSLFEGINAPDTTIEVLIGAKKFMEGWNSWRVSSMGLLNIGRKEGSSIIQLFGRGVRLRGREFSLKRSAALDGAHPKHLGLLETLNIFAVRANYMSQFREYLEKEGVETKGRVELHLPLRTNDDFLKKGLVVPRVPENSRFLENEHILLEIDPHIRVCVDMSLKVQTLESGKRGVAAAMVQAGGEQTIPDESLSLVDWERIYFGLIEYKEQKGMWNLVVRPDAPRRILADNRVYSLLADASVVAPKSFGDTELLNEAVLAIVRKYADKFYCVKQEHWDSQHMVYNVLNRDDANFQDYTVKVVRDNPRLIENIQRLIEQGEYIYQQDVHYFPSIHFDRHLYQPLLVDRDEMVQSEPPGLKPSERRFVDDLRSYCFNQENKALANRELFLLRNLSRGKGVGFFEKRGFYPDFILWLKSSNSQRIIFIEPHGMLHAGPYQHDDKARLHEVLPELAKEIEERSKIKSITLDAYIISTTPYEQLRLMYDDGNWDNQRFGDKHILFPDRNAEYIGTIIN